MYSAHKIWASKHVHVYVELDLRELCGRVGAHVVDVEPRTKQSCVFFRL